MMTRSEIFDWLQEEGPGRLEELFREADSVRRNGVGDAVHFRGLIEISNHCVRSCGYCGLRAPNAQLPRYRMTADEILACARQAADFGYGTVVLQAGEDPKLTKEWVAELIGRIKAIRLEQRGVGVSVAAATVPPVSPGGRTDKQPQRNSKDRAGAALEHMGKMPMPHGIAITLSLGERTMDELAAWKKAGADRYLLRFETSNRELFDRIHPSLPGVRSDRVAILRQLRELGYEVGSGVMIGIPGQSYEDLANDILLFAELDLDMIGVGPYLPHPQTPLGQQQPATENTEDSERKSFAGNASIGESADRQSPIGNRQSPNTELMTYKVLALTRLACPRANIPSTTALATLNRESGRELGLQRGANIVMPNLTPPQYRAMYEIYPAKACMYETAEACHTCMKRRVESIGRKVGAGRGDSPNRIKVAKAAATQYDDEMKYPSRTESRL